MALQVTKVQAWNLTAGALGLLVEEYGMYGDESKAVVRSIIARGRRTGNIPRARAVLRDIFERVTGGSAVGDHDYHHWIDAATSVGEDPFTDVNEADTHEPTDSEIV